MVYMIILMRICDRVFIEGGSRICSLRGSRIEHWLPNNAASVQANSGVGAMYGLSLMLVFFCPDRFFSGYSGAPFSSKTNISEFQFDQKSGR